MQPDTARRIAFALPEAVLAAGVAIVAAMLAFWLGCRVTACVDTTGLPWLVAAALAGLVVGAGYWLLAWRMGSRFGWRLAFDGVTLVLVVAGFFLLQVHGGHTLHERGTPDAVAPRAQQSSPPTSSFHA